eukprot:CAMPEP_0201522616 /NCGR_PEP_ID=MMETSP0161_2-20130828/18354_1 /ASSEMBLY_ACC=CAM_ASM_000251 /TAXON_ID=180227 /ORGANISM="Neoparamoeba aestuarina, Strain SoJaBio B1-5/56/2" /LENGTH=256 /DNA_ID=CAMNT_0047921521 /DNA_START=130 /DNA_END=900 /DNA_ORIENTATION=+
MLSMGKKEKKKDKAALAVAARQEQKDKERERIRQRMKERMREADEPEAEPSVMRAPTPSELSAHSSSNDTDSGDDKHEQKGKKERISEGEEEEDSSSIGISPLKSQAKNEDGEAGVTWGSNPAPPVSPRAPPRRKSLPLAQTRDPRDTKGSPKKGGQDTIEKLLERSSGPGSGRGPHSALDAARGLDGGRNSARDRGRTPSPMRERSKPKKGKGKVSPNKVSPRDEEKDQADFLAESLLREETGKNIDQMAEIGWY